MSVNSQNRSGSESDRDVNGQFRPGNKGGPGNPFASKVASLRKALMDCISEKDIRDMVTVLKMKAVTGDKAAMKLIFQYCLGRPEQPKHPDRDEAERDSLKCMSARDERFAQKNGIPACPRCGVAQTVPPGNAQDGRPAGSVHDAHRDLDDVESRTPSATDAAQPDATRTPPIAPTANAHPSPTEPTRRPNDRRPSGGPANRRPSPAPPPSPNGEMDEDCRRLVEHLQRLRREAGLTDLPPTG